MLNKDTIEQIKHRKSQLSDILLNCKLLSERLNHDIDRDPFDIVTLGDESEALNKFQSHLTALKRYSDPRPAEREITSHRKGIGPFIVFAKKLILKLGKIYTKLILNRQSKFNQNMIDLLSIFIEQQQLLQQRLEQVETSISELEDRIIEAQQSEVERSDESRQ